MEPTINEENKHKARPFTAGVVALAAFSLLAGASVSAALVDYAAPEYAEEDPFVGAVDDLTGEDTWEAKDSEKADKGPRALVGKVMKHRIDKAMEDREEHLEKRIDINTNLIAAFQFCLDSADCTADDESLSVMIEKLNWAVGGMQAKLDGTDYVDDEVKADKTDDYQICIREENGVVYYDCEDAEFKDWDERKQWDETKRMDFADEKITQLAAAQEAISFCMESEDCMADSETIGIALRHMIARAEHHRECADDFRCHRDHDERQGFRGRMGGALCKMIDRCEDKGHPLPAPHHKEVTQEMCESRMGVWTEAADRGEGVFYCDYPEKSSDESSDERSDESSEESAR